MSSLAKMIALSRAFDAPRPAALWCSPDVYASIRSRTATAPPSFGGGSLPSLLGVSISIRADWLPKSTVVLDQYGQVLSASRPVHVPAGAAPDLQAALIELAMRRPPAAARVVDRARLRRIHSMYRERRRWGFR